MPRIRIALFAMTVSFAGCNQQDDAKQHPAFAGDGTSVEEYSPPSDLSTRWFGSHVVNLCTIYKRGDSNRVPDRFYISICPRFCGSLAGRIPPTLFERECPASELPRDFFPVKPDEIVKFDQETRTITIQIGDQRFTPKFD